MARAALLLLTSGLLCAAPLAGAGAQTPPPTPPAASPATPPAAAPAPETPAAKEGTGKDGSREDEAGEHGRSADRDAYFQAHLAGLRAGLVLTPEQDKLWPPLDKAIREFAAMRDALGDQRSDRAQDRKDEAEDPVAELKATSAALLRRAQALTALADAAEPLYATLDADQKRRLPVLLGALAPRSGPVARMVERLGQDEDREEEPDRKHESRVSQDRDRGERGNWREPNDWRDRGGGWFRDENRDQRGMRGEPEERGPENRRGARMDDWDENDD